MAVAGPGGNQCIPPTLLAISVEMLMEFHRGGICTAKTDAVTLVIAFKAC